MRGATLRDLTWFDFYCLMRSQMGLKEAVKFLDEGNDAVQGALQDVIASADSKRLQGKTAGNAVSGAIMAAGDAVAEASTLASWIVKGVGLLVKGLVALFTVECDKYNCPKPRSYHRRALVGASPPPGATLHTKKGYIYWVGQHGSFHRFLHDGTEELGFGATGEDTDLGHVIGVNGFTWSSQKSRRTKRRVQKLWKFHKAKNYSPDIPDGNLGFKTWSKVKWDKDPYKKGTYAARARRVYYVLRWIEKALPCRSLKCGDDALRGTTAEKGVKEGGKSFGAEISGQRVRGGRWYASVVQMQRDLWNGLNATSERKAVALLEKFSKDAAKEYRKVRRGEPKRTWPYPWWSYQRHLSFYKLRDALKELAPILAKGNAAQKKIANQASSSGRAAREAAKKTGRVRAVNTSGLSVVRPLDKEGRARRPITGRTGRRDRTNFTAAQRRRRAEQKIRRARQRAQGRGRPRQQRRRQPQRQTRRQQPRQTQQQPPAPTQPPPAEQQPQAEPASSSKLPWLAAGGAALYFFTKKK